MHAQTGEWRDTLYVTVRLPVCLYVKLITQLIHCCVQSICSFDIQLPLGLTTRSYLAVSPTSAVMAYVFSTHI
jgi:hypothetical protein